MDELFEEAVLAATSALGDEIFKAKEQADKRVVGADRKRLEEVYKNLEQTFGEGRPVPLARDLIPSAVVNNYRVVEGERAALKHSLEEMTKVATGKETELAIAQRKVDRLEGDLARTGNFRSGSVELLKEDHAKQVNRLADVDAALGKAFYGIKRSRPGNAATDFPGQINLLAALAVEEARDAVNARSARDAARADRDQVAKDLQDLRYGVEGALKAAFDHVLKRNPPAGDYASQITALGDQVREIRDGQWLVGQMEDALDRTYRAVSRTRTSSGSPDAYADQVRALGVMVQDLNHRLSLKGEDLEVMTADRDALLAKILKFQDALSDLTDEVQL